MAKYFKYTADAADQVLIAKISDRGSYTKGTRVDNPGKISSIRITNSHATQHNLVELYLDDDTTHYVVAKTKIPAMTSLLLDEDLSYDGAKYDLKFTTNDDGGSSPLITVIIK
tara:strand:- start:87 stop:425 length:339 start_codon:yes stop_codon:yes gene_type:complete